MFAFQAMKLDIPSIGIENGAALVFENGEYSVVSDRATPLRTAYLFCPGRNAVMLNIKGNADFVAAADGERR